MVLRLFEEEMRTTPTIHALIAIHTSGRSCILGLLGA